MNTREIHASHQAHIAGLRTAELTVRVGTNVSLHPDKCRTFRSAKLAQRYRRKLIREGFFATVQPSG